MCRKSNSILTLENLGMPLSVFLSVHWMHIWCNICINTRVYYLTMYRQKCSPNHMMKSNCMTWKNNKKFDTYAVECVNWHTCVDMELCVLCSRIAYLLSECLPRARISTQASLFQFLSVKEKLLLTFLCTYRASLSIADKWGVFSYRRTDMWIDYLFVFLVILFSPPTYLPPVVFFVDFLTGISLQQGLIFSCFLWKAPGTSKALFDKYII